MPSVSRKQQRLFQAAAHGATFPKAQAIRDTMSVAQIAEFADTIKAPHPAKNLGGHLKRPTGGEIVTTHHRRRGR